MVIRFPVCAQRGCGEYAVYRRDRCAQHCADFAAYQAEALAALTGSGPLEGLNLAGIQCRGLDLRERELIGCRFTGASWEGVRLDGAVLHHVSVDFATLTECSLRAIRMTLSIFAGTELRRVEFGDSNLARNNYIGCAIADSSFRGSDLTACAFTAARLTRVNLQDCNLYDVQFGNAVLEEVDLRYSNPDEAHFS